MENYGARSMASRITIKKYGFPRVMCGVGGEGTTREAENIGADLKRCADGVWCATELG